MKKPRTSASSRALRFVLLVGAMSLFADMTYEGGRSILGPYLALLGASATAVGAVSAAVPALALAGSWEIAAVLLVLERVGRAIRNPPRDAMLSVAGEQMGGYGWAFGLHEALDQAGAMVGPLAVAAILARRGEYRTAFAALLLPAIVTLVLLAAARPLYPKPERFERHAAETETKGMPRVFWIYLAGAALVAAGFADYPLIAFHFHRSGSVPSNWVPVLYALAMGTGGASSLVVGRLFDRYGMVVLVPLTIASAVFAPLVFLGGFGSALAGAALWGVGTGVHESIIPAAVAPMVPPARRASAYGLFTAGYGLLWFLGSALVGFLYDVSIPVMVAVCVVLELCAIPFFLIARRQPVRS